MKIIGMAGWSGAGKTTLIEQVIPVLRRRGVSVSTLKHAHHRFDMDREGKDSWRHREAGASEVLIVSDSRWVLLNELRGAPEPTLPELLAKLSPVDLVILEGWRNGSHPKIEVWRQANEKPFLFTDDRAICGLISDSPERPSDLLPGLAFAHPSNIEGIADIMVAGAGDVSAFAKPCQENGDGQ